MLVSPSAWLSLTFSPLRPSNLSPIFGECAFCLLCGPLLAFVFHLLSLPLSAFVVLFLPFFLLPALLAVAHRLLIIFTNLVLRFLSLSSGCASSLDLFLLFVPRYLTTGPLSFACFLQLSPNSPCLSPRCMRYGILALVCFLP